MEGSTQLLTRLGDRYVDALDAQRGIQRDAWTAHEGTELGTEGDSFYVAFSTAEHAVAAVAAAQRALARHTWPGDLPVRVRMGLHTGSPIPHDGAYVGIDVHRAARISASAHGGQVVLSEATAGLVARSLPSGIRLRDLGDHRFKDIQQPEHVFQLEVEGLPSEFPPLRSLGASSCLPSFEGSLLGRDDDLARLRELLSGGARLVTLIGPGGAGKTTLAVALARGLVERLPVGAYFAGLAAAEDEDAMWSAIAESLGLAAADCDPESVCAHLAPRRAVLVLDNLEQLDAAAGGARRMLDAAPDLTVVATSRRPLHLHDEHEFDVAPLALPAADADGAARDSPSVQLFLAQACRVRPTFELTDDNIDDVVAICRRLDGMPLGIELAAARTRLLTPRLLLGRLASALDLATPAVDRPARHHTLRETIAWSYQLLDESQRTTFEDLGAFAGGADLAAIAAVCGPDLAGREGVDSADSVDLACDLVDASLARIADDGVGEPRVVQLETIHAFAIDALASSPRRDAVRERHARYFAERVRADVIERVGDTRQDTRDRLEAERENYIAALDWAVGDDAPVDDAHTTVALELIRDVVSQWVGSHVRDAVMWSERAVERSGGRTDSLMVRALATLANLHRFMGDRARSHECASRALAMARPLGDRCEALSFVLRTMAISEFEAGRIDDIRDLYSEAVEAARREGGYRALHSALWEAGWFEMTQRSLERGRMLMEESFELAQSQGNVIDAVDSGHSLSKIVLLEGRVAEAEPLMRAGLRQAVAVCDDFDLSAGMDDYAVVLAELGRPDEAARLAGSVDGYFAAHDLTRGRQDEIDTAPVLEAARAAMKPDEWRAAYDQGAATPVRDALREALARSDEWRPE
jgi:predicted ATPase